MACGRWSSGRDASHVSEGSRCRVRVQHGGECATGAIVSGVDEAAGARGRLATCTGLRGRVLASARPLHALATSPESQRGLRRARWATGLLLPGRAREGEGPHAEHQTLPTGHATAARFSAVHTRARAACCGYSPLALRSRVYGTAGVCGDKRGAAANHTPASPLARFGWGGRACYCWGYAAAGKGSRALHINNGRCATEEREATFALLMGDH